MSAEVMSAAPAETTADDSQVKHTVSELVRKISAEPNNNARSSEALPVQSVAVTPETVSREPMQEGSTEPESATDEIQASGVEDAVVEDTVNEPPVTDSSVVVEPVSSPQVRSGGLLMGLVRRFFSWVRRIVRL